MPKSSFISFIHIFEYLLELSHTNVCRMFLIQGRRLKVILSKRNLL